MNHVSYFIAPFVVLFCASVASGLGGDHKGPVGGSDKWPAGLKDLANRSDRVHGYFVNWEDVFYFAGKTPALNDFLSKYATLPNTKLEVVLHPGAKQARSPWDTVDRDINVDWMLYSTPFTAVQLTGGKVTPGPFVTKLEIWLGGKISLADLKVPKNIEVRSSGEIERFVSEHQGKRHDQKGDK